MAKLTKKQKQIREIVEFGKVYPIAEAIEVLKQLDRKSTRLNSSH